MELSKIENYKSILFTFIQYALLLVFILRIPFFLSNICVEIVKYSGIFLGIYSIWTMRKSKLKITPNPHRDAILITSGPYKYIRHPMYSAILLTIFPMVVSENNAEAYFLLFAILISLLFKLNFEEKLLARKFENWKEYSKNTFKIVPFVY